MKPSEEVASLPRVRSFMATDVLSVASCLPASEAWVLMRSERVHHLVVTDGGLVQGILSDRDLGSVAGGVVRQHRQVAECMQPLRCTIAPNDSLRLAAARMLEENVGSLPVVDGDIVVGILTKNDILAFVADIPLSRVPRAPTHTEGLTPIPTNPNADKHL